MTSTVFVDQVTPVPASWLNDVNTSTYTTVPGFTAAIAAKANSGANTDITSLRSFTLASNTAEADLHMQYSGQTKTTYFVKNAAAQIGYFNGTDSRWAWWTDYSYKTTFGGKIEADDVTTYRPLTPNTGYYYFGNTGTKYVGYDGTNFSFVGGALVASAFSGAGTFLSGTASLLDAGVGAAQTWQQPARSPATTYTNSTGRPIQVLISSGHPSVFNATAAFVNGVQIAICYGITPGGSQIDGGTISFIVPNGATYQVTVASANIYFWSELR